MKIHHTLTLLCALFAFAAVKNVPAADTPQPPEGAPDYVAPVDPGAGQHLALTLQKLEEGFTPERPFLIWALGSSYTNMLGTGEFWRDYIPRHFPNAPAIEYKKMVGNSCSWQYLSGWARHLALPDNPDLIITYTIGDPADLERLILEIRRNSTADIIVPSIHWRERDQPNWGLSENAVDQDVAAVRAICAKYGVEFVESRKHWAEYLEAHKLPIPALLKDAVHQSDYGREIINRNIATHFRKADQPSYDPSKREHRLTPAIGETLTFTGNRIDLVGRKSPDGGTLTLTIDGQSANEIPAFFATYVQPGEKNFKEPSVVPRDNSPHGVILGGNLVPQTWTITVTSDKADFELNGSVTGPDGKGNATQPFTSTSGQIRIDPAEWRRSERTRAGDTFTFEVYRTTLAEVDFTGDEGELFRVHLVRNLSNGEHTLELTAKRDGLTSIDFLEVFTPPF